MKNDIYRALVAKKKFFTLLIAIVTGIGTISAEIIEQVQIGDLYYNLDTDNKTAKVTSQVIVPWDGGNYTLSEVTIPPSVEYASETYSVTSIRYSAFFGCSSLTSIEIPSSVTNIETQAFMRCDSLTSIAIPNGVTSIGYATFLGCHSLTSIEIPNSVTSFGDYAFAECWSLTSIEIPYGVTSIEYGTFWSCGLLTFIEIPNSVTSIGDYAFYYCVGLTSITIGNSVTSVGDYAFAECWSLASIEIPNSVTSIGDDAFGECNSLTDIYATCGDIDRVRQLFNNDSRVKYKPLSYLPYSIAINANNGQVILPQNICEPLELNAIPDYGYHFAQWSDGFTDNPRAITLTQDTTFTAEFAPNKYSISVSCDETYGSIDGESGEFDYLTEKTYKAIPNYGYHFDRWSDSVYICDYSRKGECYEWHYEYITDNPRTVTLTQDTAFSAIFALNKYTIWDNSNTTQGHIEGIGTFDYLSQQELNAVPNHGYHFVQWSDGVTDNPRPFVLTQDTTFTAEFAQTFSGQCGDDLYWGFANDTLTFSGSGNMYNYSFDNVPWALFITETKYIDFSPELTSIGAYAFNNMTIPKINLPATIQSIGAYAFANCTEIHYMTIPNGVSILESGAFFGCSGLDSLIVGTGITTIQDQFRGCSGLHYLQLGQNIQSIGYGSFYDARQLTSIVCYAKYPPLAYPDEVGKERSFYNMNARVLVPCDNFEEYEVDALWGNFNLKCLSSESGTATAESVTVIPGDASATFTWPIYSNAVSYSLVITKDGIVFCTLHFNAQGQLLGIAFAPSQNGQPHKTRNAALSADGMTFQVTGLDYASHYRFSFDTKDEASQTIFAYEGAFHTNGTNTPEGLNDVDAVSKTTKLLRNGQILIIRGEKTYTLTGQQVRYVNCEK